MNNLISSIMETNIITVELDDTIEYTAMLLDSHKLSCVPVIDPKGRCFGVISATDLLHFYNYHKNPKTKHAWEVCTHAVIEVSSDTSVKEASEIMVNNKIHHLIVTENNATKGIVSSIDLIEKGLLNNKIPHLIVTENNATKGIVSSIDLIEKGLLNKNSPEATKRTTLTPRADIVIEKKETIKADISTQTKTVKLKDVYSELIKLDYLLKRKVITKSEFKSLKMGLFNKKQ